MTSSVSTGQVQTGGSRICYQMIATTRSQTVLSIAYSAWADDWDVVDDWDDMLRDNQCLPSLHHFYDRGFALTTKDPWYGGRWLIYDYRSSLPYSLVGVGPPSNRRKVDADMDIRSLRRTALGSCKIETRLVKQRQSNWYNIMEFYLAF